MPVSRGSLKRKSLQEFLIIFSGLAPLASLGFADAGFKGELKAKNLAVPAMFFMGFT
jgi:hypothetical protein